VIVTGVPGPIRSAGQRVIFAESRTQP